MPLQEWDQRPIPFCRSEHDAGSVESVSVAHSLPELYLKVLERATALEATGRRGEALILRRAALTTYSGAWDAEATRRLEALRARAERVLDGVDRPRSLDSGRTTLRWSRSA